MRPFIRTAGVVAVVLVAAACSKTSSPTSGVASNTTVAPPSSASGSTSSTSGGSAASCPNAPTPMQDHGTSTASGTTIHVEAGEFYFAATCMKGLPPNSTVTLIVHNGGQILHNVSFAAQGIDQDVAPGQTITVTVKLGAPGGYSYFCKYHRAAGMQGVLVAGST